MLGKLFKKPKPREQSVNSSKGIIQLSQLCSACSRYLQRHLPSDRLGKYQDHHVVQDDFMQSVEENCAVCTIVGDSLGQLPYASKLQIAPRGALMIYVKADYPEGVPKPGGITDNDITVGISMLPGAEILPYLTRTIPANTSGSESSITFARKCLQKCQEAHTNCNLFSNIHNWQPSRLIKVEKRQGEISAQLYITSKGKSLARYLTLSHCWGKQEIFRLTTSNLKELENKIPMGSLPTVFRDAMYITNQLGYEYLWIDSLCICQDSKQDWLKESSTMGLIYRYGECNIAATGFSDGQNGLFVRRNPRALLPRRINSTLDPERSGTITQGMKEYYLLDDDFWQKGVTKAPLNTRGWVVQERLLSPRTLHFGARQLFWECLEMRCCEVFPKGLPRKTAQSSIKLSFHSQERFTDIHMEGEMPPLLAASEAVARNWYTLWHRVVQTYSRSKLTRAEDKMPAISGAAQYFRSLLRDDYLAGLWRGNFVRDLLWTVTEQSKVVLYHSWLAPTWSWASLDSEVHFISSWSAQLESDMEHALVLDVQIDPISNDKTGPIMGAILKIRGRVIPLVRSFLSFRKYGVGNGVEIELLVNFDVPGEGVYDRSSGIPLQLQESRYARYYTSERTSIPQRMFALPLLTTSYGDNIATKGIVLTSSSTSNGHFSRIGVFTINDETSRRELFKSRQHLSSELFLECDRDMHYTITII